MIEDIFYNEVIPECKTGKLEINDFYPTIAFETIINNSEIETNLPKLIINDKERFNKTLNLYVKKAINFYYYGIYNHDNIKSCISYVFSNATNNDLTNPIIYLNNRINMLENNIVEDFNENFLEYSSNIKISKNKDILEAPYKFEYEVLTEDESYVFPEIVFGLVNDKCYIYSIQNKFKENNNLKKKINRLLYKFNNNFNDLSDSDIFNAKDVSMPFVATLILFLNYLNKIGIKKINVPVNLPIRYNSHFMSNDRRLNYLKKIKTNDEFLLEKEKIDLLNKSYEENIILKFIRTFYRTSKMGNVLEINTYPFVSGSELKLTINENGTFNNEFCNSIYKPKPLIK